MTKMFLCLFIKSYSAVRNVLWVHLLLCLSLIPYFRFASTESYRICYVSTVLRWSTLINKQSLSIFSMNIFYVGHTVIEPVFNLTFFSKDYPIMLLRSKSIILTFIAFLFPYFMVLRGIVTMTLNFFVWVRQELNLRFFCDT